jgi:aminoglycoside phosphotransferase
MKTLKDQYDRPVPKDLVALPTYSDLSPAEVETVFNAKWYKSQGVLMASFKALKGLSEIDPADCGVTFDEETVIDRVADSLKHGNVENGFYHS